MTQAGSGTPDICLVSGADEIRLRSYVNHAIYARLHDLDYRLECGLDEGVKTKFFYKTSIIRRVLPRYDWVVWLDDDTFVTDFESDNFRRLIDACRPAPQTLESLVASQRSGSLVDTALAVARLERAGWLRETAGWFETIDNWADLA